MPRQGLDAARVVAEAAALADADGVAALSLAAVAGRLGVKPPSLYKHVAGLDALHAAVAVAAVEEVGEVLAAAIAGRAGRDALQALGRAWVGYAREHPGRYALSVRAADLGDPTHVAAVDRVLALLRAVVRRPGQADAEELHAIRVVRSALHGFCTIEAEGSFRMPLAPDASLDRLLDVLARGLELAG